MIGKIYGIKKTPQVHSARKKGRKKSMCKEKKKLFLMVALQQVHMEEMLESNHSVASTK